MTRLRVIQWATGNVGKHAVAAVHEHPDLQLVGALVYSDEKAGRDVDEILALDADCVLYMPMGDWNPQAAIG